MEKDLQEIAKILNFNNSFFEEVESFSRLGFYEIDLISGELKASTNFKKLFNLPEKSLYYIEEYQKLIHPNDLAGVAEAFGACQKEKRNYESDYRVIVNGDVRYIRGQAIFISDEKGEPVKVIGMKQDVTHEKLAEIERLEYIKQLEHAHEVTSTIVHDLKAPIHNISIIVQLLKGSVADDMESLIQVLEESCQRSYDIIEDVLEKSLVEGRVYKNGKEWHDIHKPINKAVSTLYYTAQKKNIKILTSLQPDIYAFVYPQKLQRAIENLLSNAVKFSHRDSHIEVSLYEREEAIVIKVEDFGLGMDESQKEMLFDKENDLRRSGTDGEKSSGLGMNIVKKITNQHGGRLKVESQPSVGTKFYIELPKE